MVITAIEIVRRKAVTEEIDYPFLMDCLSAYSYPRDKVTELLRSGSLIRVKKGLYVFGADYASRPFSKEVLANLIYGPSYISSDSALSFYGAIPERIERVSSMTCKRRKLFKTPVGEFLYNIIRPEAYSFGITQISLRDVGHVLMATPEKALVDRIASMKGVDATEGMIQLLLEDFRIADEFIRSLRLSHVKILSGLYKKRSVVVLHEALKEMT